MNRTFPIRNAYVATDPTGVVGDAGTDRVAASALSVLSPLVIPQLCAMLGGGRIATQFVVACGRSFGRSWTCAVIMNEEHAQPAHQAPSCVALYYHGHRSNFFPQPPSSSCLDSSSMAPLPLEFLKESVFQA